MATENDLLTAMDAEQFPSFTKSGFYREWLRSQLIFPDQTEEQKRHLLELAFYIYQEVRATDRKDPALPER
jgi:hypothetical protein